MINCCTCSGMLMSKCCSPALYSAWRMPLRMASSSLCTPSSLQRLSSTGTTRKVGAVLVPYWQGMRVAGRTAFRVQSDAPSCLAWHGWWHPDTQWHAKAASHCWHRYGGSNIGNETASVPTCLLRDDVEPVHSCTAANLNCCLTSRLFGELPCIALLIAA